MRISAAGMATVLLLLACGTAPLVAQAAGGPAERLADADYAGVLAALPDSTYDRLPLAAKLTHIQAEARSGRAEKASPHLAPLLAEQGSDPRVRSAAAAVALAAGDFAGARAHADAALAAGGLTADGWLVDAVVRLYEGRESEAARSYRRALAAQPSLAGSRFTTFVEHALLHGTDGATPLFTTRVAADSVAVPLTPCWAGSPYRCIDLVVGGHAYRTLLDTGNAPGWSVHDAMLAAALTVLDSATQRAWTGSVGAVSSRRFVMERVDFGAFSLGHAPGVFFAKPSDPYFDANLNPFTIRDRVVTLDYGRGLFILRSKARFDRWLAARPRDGWTRVPVAGHGWPYVAAAVNGRPATAVIETGAEELSLSRAYAERNGISLTPVSELFRGREFRFHRAAVRAEIGGLRLPVDTATVPGSRYGDPLTGFAWDLMVGPGVLDPAFALTFDPVDRCVVLERL